ncbi:TIGR04139 family peptide modification target [Chryseobacterium sp. G0186]|uniref:TIGR04139 family peptide modification target n=1 Tax=Chryseobacterium sp. G0186 TaxID=2487064 RepID=UPI000F510CB5|nr:TIGR04139 family peptide modification target [Chryseobacterium sp. G0186]AZA79442.1 TIGR04139 family peptide modification target [Chryseobacterium sp. G0186]
MKKLIGMKRDFSSLENKKINRNDLKSVQGAGEGYSYISTDCGSNCYDKETWKGGVRLSTLFIG